MEHAQNKLSWETIEGSSYPLGVTYVSEDNSFNFSIYSKHATQVTLLIYADDDFVNPFFTCEFAPLINKSHFIWHCRIRALHPLHIKPDGHQIPETNPFAV